jgi:CheY-like chemotaxis protein
MDTSTVSASPIVVIDDSPDDLFLFERLVKQCALGVPLVTFQDARDAVQYLTRISQEAEHAKMPCFIFTDIKMPSMTGFEFLEWLRGEELLGKLPVAVLSSSGHDWDVNRARDLRADYYFVKFPTADELAQLLKPVVAKASQAGSPSR